MVWDLFEDMTRMNEEVDRMFEGVFRRGWHGGAPLPEGREGKLAPYSGFRRPLAEVQDAEGSVVAKFEIPGVEKNDIELNVTDEFIEVKVEKKAEKEQKKKGFYSYESRARQFYKRLPLPAGAEPERAEAEYKNGVLSVKLPKSKRALERKKHIQIK